MQTGILIFEDNDQLRESLVYLLGTDERYCVLGSYNNCNEATTLTLQFKPGIVLMDIDMPGIGGIAGVEKVKEAHPEAAVIMYTIFEDDEKLFACLCAGANGYLLKKTSPAHLFDALEEVINGGAPMSPGIAKKVLASFKKPVSKHPYGLSARELQVLLLLMEGHSTKIIASSLFISFETVRSHLKNIYIKLHVNCGKQAIAKVLSEKIL